MSHDGGKLHVRSLAVTLLIAFLTAANAFSAPPADETQIQGLDTCSWIDTAEGRRCQECSFDNTGKKQTYWGRSNVVNANWPGPYRFRCNSMTYGVHYKVEVSGLQVCPHAGEATPEVLERKTGKIYWRTLESHRLPEGDTFELGIVAEQPNGCAPVGIEYPGIATFTLDTRQARDAKTGFADFTLRVGECRLLIRGVEGPQTNCTLVGGKFRIWAE